ncbi:MAG: hypothetical protein RIS45_619 [Planctomycetota bacterium]
MSSPVPSEPTPQPEIEPDENSPRIEATTRSRRVWRRVGSAAAVATLLVLGSLVWTTYSDRPGELDGEELGRIRDGEVLKGPDEPPAESLYLHLQVAKELCDYLARDNEYRRLEREMLTRLLLVYSDEDEQYEQSVFELVNALANLREDWASFAHAAHLWRRGSEPRNEQLRQKAIEYCDYAVMVWFDPAPSMRGWFEFEEAYQDLADSLLDPALRPACSPLLHKFLSGAVVFNGPRELFAHSMVLRHGLGVTADPRAADEFLRRAADEGCMYAQYASAMERLWEAEKASAADARSARVQAAELLSRSSMQGYMPAIAALADCYANGWGVGADPRRAELLTGLLGGFTIASRAGAPPVVGRSGVSAKEALEQIRARGCVVEVEAVRRVLSSGEAVSANRRWRAY